MDAQEPDSAQQQTPADEDYVDEDESNEEGQTVEEETTDSSSRFPTQENSANIHSEL